MAINIPPDIKTLLSEYQERQKPKFKQVFGDKHSHLVRWTKMENLHLTLSFLGNIESQKIEALSGVLKNSLEDETSFDFYLNKTFYAPPGKFPVKMIWLSVLLVPDLERIKKNIDKSLENSDLFPFTGDKRGFKPHVTLARIKPGFTREELPEIEDSLDLNFRVEKIDLMSSVLKKQGPEYSVLKNFHLKDT